jgi:hypothetical protein
MLNGYCPNAELNGCCTNAERVAIPNPLLWRNCRTKEFVMQMMEAFTNEKPLHRKYALKILCGMSELLQTLPSLVDVPIAPGGKITVCGDTHGQCHIVHNVWLSGPRVSCVAAWAWGSAGWRMGSGWGSGLEEIQSNCDQRSSCHLHQWYIFLQRGCCCDLNGLRGIWVHTTGR